MKTLYLLRHAKSDWDSDFEIDHNRGLAPRGIKAAERLAMFMDDFGFQVELCVSSTAVRCKETWKIIQKNYKNVSKEYKENKSIYEADLETLLDLIKSTEDHIESQMIIGHNPGLEELAEYLVLGESRDELHNPLFSKFPTSAFLGLSLSVEDWRDISPGQASIIVYWIPGRKGR